MSTHSLEQLYDLYLQSDGVSTDTRTVRRDALFFALKGEHFDGNSFAYNALDKGALAAIVDDEALKKDARFKANADRMIFVEDPLLTLQKLANKHRKKISIPVIGLTGTNGKTTTKELTATVLEEKYRIVRTEGNLNNHIGVPLTLLRIRKSTEIAIIEMGANHINDIRELCAIAEPTHGLITNIGSAHLEGFGSKEGVAKAKGALYEWLRDHTGTIFIRKEDSDLIKLLCSLDPGCAAETIRYGEEPVPENKNLFGLYNKDNMKAAYAIGHYFKVPKASIIKALKNYEPKNMRSQKMQTKKGNEIILDAYNANPSSMKAALESFSSFETTKPKWLILGDMKELGEFSNDAHREIIKDLSFYCFSNVVLIGESFTKAHGDLKRFACFTTKDEFLASPFVSSIKNATVLIKGSNSMKMWEIVEHL